MSEKSLREIFEDIAAQLQRLKRAEVLAAAIPMCLDTDHATLKRMWFFFMTGRDEPVGGLDMRELERLAKTAPRVSDQSLKGQDPEGLDPKDEGASDAQITPTDGDSHE